MSETQERGSRANRDRTQVIPHADRPDVFAFIERLFFGTEDKPERIELRQAYGPGCRKYGDVVIHLKEFKGNTEKPNKEKMAALSNEFVEIAQSNCNEIGKAHKYALLAKHTTKSAAPYGVWIISMMPKQSAHYDPAAPEDEDEDAPGAFEKRHARQLMEHSLDHIKQSDENERWRQEQFSAAMGHILERCDVIIQGQSERIKFLETRNIEMLTVVEQSLDKKQERDMKYENHRMKIDGIREAGKVLSTLLPVAVNRLTARSNDPATAALAEADALAPILGTLTEDQQAQLWGPPVKEGETAIAGRGILTPDQAVILCSVADKAMDAAALEQLLEGGQHPITNEQLNALASVLAQEQIIPLVDLFTQIKNRKEARAKGAQ